MFKIYVNWMNLINNNILPLALLIGMNIRIYRTMQNQWGVTNCNGETDNEVSNTNTCENLQKVTLIIRYCLKYF